MSYQSQYRICSDGPCGTGISHFENQKSKSKRQNQTEKEKQTIVDIFLCKKEFRNEVEVIDIENDNVNKTDQDYRQKEDAIDAGRKGFNVLIGCDIGHQ